MRLLIITAIAAVLVACQDTTGPEYNISTHDQIKGVWISQDDPGVRFHFYDDNSFVSTVDGHVAVKGEWFYNDHALFIDTGEIKRYSYEVTSVTLRLDDKVYTRDY